ncbi:flagellar motor switch phosphatase FliY [Neobacillus sp. MM2021_6]|uniref:flagellar motor switch phosphatase FliY n=1 Tax=Bacillaceae TaxID=186817 RepID=UPI001408DEC1|nr:MULTISPECIES: flagellar motor switch phosphatase FliY [Bacillaceae]MBO0961803.1 flagellar motor switch phosphatase FliY [Neobacillus sp. MM2021_6]NHC21088.1 flagellar motor switch phosphatase FliY [Bacillus sp. MM2020_4]
MKNKMNEGSLSQDEINALFSQMESTPPSLSIDDFLSSMEQDALGEIGNISLGSSTTALSALLNQRVEITTPTLSIIEQEQMEDLIQEKHVAVHVDYTIGFRGKNLLMIKEKDARIIANLMMGGDGLTLEPELSEMHLSAVQEAMNQMMGSAATSMSTLFSQKVDISPPTVDVLGFPPKKLEDLEDKIIIKVSFRLKVGSLIDSNMVQFIPLSFAKEMIHKILSPAKAAEPVPVKKEPIIQQANTGASQTATAPMTEQQAPQNVSAAPINENANVQKVEYATFSKNSQVSAGAGNLDLLYDIPLTITVELGRTDMPIKKILELGPGAVIELDKLAGEPVDILANQKLIAKGEVVVIEENFGVRITDIVSTMDRISKMAN